MSRPYPSWTARIDDLGAEETRTIIRTIIASCLPHYMMIDAFEICDIDLETERAMRELAQPYESRGGASVHVDPTDARSLNNLIIFAPYSAGVEIGMAGPAALILEIHDADWIGLHLTGEQLAAAGVRLGAAWKRTQPDQGD